MPGRSGGLHTCGQADPTKRSTAVGDPDPDLDPFEAGDQREEAGQCEAWEPGGGAVSGAGAMRRLAERLVGGGVR